MILFAFAEQTCRFQDKNTIRLLTVLKRQMAAKCLQLVGASGGKHPSAFKERGWFHADTNRKDDFNIVSQSQNGIK